MTRPGVLAVVTAYGRRLSLAGCARCGQVRVLLGRGLCGACRSRCRRDGTLTDYGYTKADRMTEYAQHRAGGLGVREAAERAGVSERSGQRYEAERRSNTTGGK